jgi:ATP-dependent Lon protease
MPDRQDSDPAAIEEAAEIQGLKPIAAPPEMPRALPILPLKNTVVFPHIPTPLAVGRPGSIRLIDEAMLANRLVGLVTQRDAGTEDPREENLYRVGTAAVIQKLLKFPDGTIRVLVSGLQRIRLVRMERLDPYMVAEVEALVEELKPSVEVEALMKNLGTQIGKVLSLMPIDSEELGVAFLNIDDPGRLADMAAALLVRDTALKQEALEALDVEQRLRMLTRQISRDIEVLELGSKIQQQVQDEMEKGQREFVLRQQLKAIQKELGEGDDADAEMSRLQEAIEKAGMTPAAREVADRELKRLRGMSPAAPEHVVARTYLDWLIALPWSKETRDSLDIAAAHKVLDEDHYDLEKVKDRILEFLAVRRLSPAGKGPILCFVGPPGTGKTSLGRSIARAMGRTFHRVSLGGVRDEAEIRGHRRTYVGALPGRIIEGLRKCGTRNPVFILDEIDKLGTDFRGDPASALLEVLDPEQNRNFVDHYLDVPFDLSAVTFLTTANVLDTIPAPLRDRMEVLQLSGYSAEEKLAIARRFLIPRQCAENGITPGDIVFEDAAIAYIVAHYTQEAGLRNLEREIGSVCRKVARRRAEGATGTVTVRVPEVIELLGPERITGEVAERGAQPGVAIGLAWTPFGGQILFVEATRMPGGKSLILTGQLGDVMRESAQAALSYVRSRAASFGVDANFFATSDLHLHVPAGAIPKDGPSAGVTLATALVSLLSGRPCRPFTAMTGEITLRGKVLPVGGIKEKVLAARRAGIKTIILPADNQKDLLEIPKETRDSLEFRYARTVDEVLRAALLPARGDRPKAPVEKVPRSSATRRVAAAARRAARRVARSANL